MAASGRKHECMMSIVYYKTIAVDSLWKQRLEDAYVMTCVSVYVCVHVRVRARACAMRSRCVCLLA